MQGKVCLITGATDGIGKQTALELARLGATVVIVGRNPTKTAAVVEQIKHETGNHALSALLADLSVQAQVRQLASDFKANFDRLDVLINNAGVLQHDPTITVDGVEMTWAVNYLAPFILTHELLDVLKASAPSRIINLTSWTHKLGKIDLNRLGDIQKYNIWTAYARSKLADVLFTVELARRLQGTGVTANAVHPGEVLTNIVPNPKFNPFVVPFLWVYAKLALVDIATGAQPSVQLATSPDLKYVSGQYFNRLNIEPLSKKARDPLFAKQLWEATERTLA